MHAYISNVRVVQSAFFHGCERAGCYDIYKLMACMPHRFIVPERALS
jgi:hypothetical protein